MASPDPPRRAGATTSRAAPERAAEPRRRTPRVLVVDDEAGMRLVLGRALARAGYQVFSAATGREALDQLTVLRDLDLVVSDVTMPGMTGVELGREILRRHPGLPVLFVTASAVPRELLDHPLVDLLAKPPAFAVLQESATTLIARAAAAGTAT